MKATEGNMLLHHVGQILLENSADDTAISCARQFFLLVGEKYCAV